MNKTLRWTAVLALMGALAVPARARQEGVQVYARLSAGVLRLGDTGTVTVTVENAEDARIVEVPRVERLALGNPDRPRTQDFTEWVNGRVYRKFSLVWRVPVRPEEAGDFEIPPFVVEAAGKTFRTQPLHLTVVVDLRGEDLGFLEVKPSSTRVVEGQPFTVELLFGWDSSTEVTFAELSLPWWNALPGLLELEQPPPPPDAQQVTGIVVNRETQVAAEQLEPRARSGRSFHALRLTRHYLPTRSGSLEFPTSFFEFGRSRSFSIFETRPSRRESYFVQAQPFTLEVVALPSAGQPLDFSGAVGRLTVRTSTDSRDVKLGDSIKLAVEWSGQGNLEFFRAPDPAALDSFRGFRVYGSTEEKSFERRKVTYDLSPLSTDVREIPALPLTVFDPEAGRYETVATDPIPIRVRPLEKASALGDEEGPRFERDIADIDARPLSRAREPFSSVPGDAFVLGALVGVPVLGLAARTVLRRRAGDPAAPLERRRRRARRELERALARADGAQEELAAFLAYLAARTRESPQAWSGRDLARWSASDGVALEDGAREQGAALLERLEEAVYGGGAPAGREAILATAALLERSGL